MKWEHTHILKTDKGNPIGYVTQSGDKWFWYGSALLPKAWPPVQVKTLALGKEALKQAWYTKQAKRVA